MGDVDMYFRVNLQSVYGWIVALMSMLRKSEYQDRNKIQDKMAAHSVRMGVIGFPVTMSVFSANILLQSANIQEKAPFPSLQLPSLTMSKGSGFIDSSPCLSSVWLLMFVFLMRLCSQGAREFIYWVQDCVGWVGMFGCSIGIDMCSMPYVLYRRTGIKAWLFRMVWLW